MILASYVGNWYDRSGRWLGAQGCLLFNNLSVAISAGLLVVSLSLSNNAETSTGETVGYLASLFGAITFCAIAMAAASGEKTAFSKDWIVVMVSSFCESETNEANSQSSQMVDSAENRAAKYTKKLSTQNAILRVIDQFSSIVSPIVGGVILDTLGLKATCYVMVGWNFIGWLGESFTLHWVYQRVPNLALKKSQPKVDGQTQKGPAMSIFGMLKLYFGQAVFPAAFGLALLYMTVLAFDGISISFGQKQGLDSTILGVFQAIGASLGMLAAIGFPAITSWLGLHKGAFLGLSEELACLGICVVSVFLPGSPFDLSGYFGSLTWHDWWKTFVDTFDASSADKKTTNSTGMNWSDFTVNHESAASLFTLYSGIALARFGLWLTDLAITQLMQESIEESLRGTIFGVETAFCQFFSVAKDVIAILLPDSKTFGLLVFVSVCAVGTAFLLFFCFQIKKLTAEARVADQVHPVTQIQVDTVDDTIPAVLKSNKNSFGTFE
uniref:Solute carrier family 40 member n=1 Tax=Panagrolaimus sp. JU765 TaxID=591449 RepID=A0AC34Q3X4_9BILA